MSRALCPWLPVACALVALLLVRSASADPALALGQDGAIGAWLLAGPLGRSQLESLDVTSVEPAAGKPLVEKYRAFAFRALAHRSEALDLKKELRAGDVRGPAAVAAGVLRVPDDVEAWLLLSADGGVDVHLDGKRIWGRTSDRVRGRSWDAIPVRLARGTHTLLLKLYHPGRHWAFSARLLDRRDLSPPNGARWTLPGVSEPEWGRLARDLLDGKLVLTPNVGGYSSTLTLDFPRGAPLTPDLSVTVSVERSAAAAERQSFRVGRMPVSPRGVHALEVSLPPLRPDQLEERYVEYRVDARVGATSLKTAGLVHAEVVSRLAALTRLESTLDARKLMSKDIVRATLAWRRHELQVAEQRAEIAEALREAERWMKWLEEDVDPLTVPGVRHVALLSPLDGKPHEIQLHVPQGFSTDGSQRYPLVVLLHGYDGSPRGIIEAFLDRKGTAAHPGVDGFLVAPSGHGNAFYRGPGEHNVMHTIDHLSSVYPIDPERVAISGVSMGGTGSAHLALRYADRFSAAAPLCGYHSYFVRRDTANRPIARWERERMHHWSPASWAENGRHVPLFVAHGQRDFPLENSKVLIRRYRELGYAVEEEWPDTGHHVWDVSYANARLWPWLSRKVRPSAPSHVTVQTDALRYGRQYWVAIEQFEKSGSRGRVEAKLETPGRIVVTTDNVDRLTLTRPAGAASELEIAIDARTLPFGASHRVSLERRAGSWRASSGTQAGPGWPPLKRAGLEGPIRDAYVEPLAFVYGSRRAETRRANREVAEALTEYRRGLDVEYPVLADWELTAELQKSHHLVLIGTSDDHAVLADISDRLPIRATKTHIVLGQRELWGSDVGAMFVYPNPKQPTRYVVVVTAPSPAGIWRVLSLPRLLPDYVVFDAGIADAATEQIFGQAKPLAAGFFDSRWQLVTE